MPEPLITIAIEPSGRVSAKGADALAATLLRRAGFTEVSDWHGLRHRLPLSTPPEEQADVAIYAAQMLRAARYRVDLDPDPDINDPHSIYIAGGTVLGLTDRINAAPTADKTAEAVNQLLDPTDGVLIRLQEAIEATAEKVNDLDEENGWELSDRFTAASELLTQIGHDLDGAVGELRALAPAPNDEQPRPGWQAQVATYYATAVTHTARTTSPATGDPSAPASAASQTGTQPTRRTR